jgi:hypothetical protein
MGEPITLHDASGNTYTVYSRSAAEAMLRGGQWYATEAEAAAGKGGATVEEPVTVSAPPAPAKPTPRRGKA